MTWFKVDDTWWAHPKTLMLSEGAVALWVRAGSWSAQNLTDGHVPKAAVRLLGAKAAAASELVAAGLWHANGDGWVFHDWHAYQPSRAEVLARREKWRSKRRGQRHGGGES